MTIYNINLGIGWASSGVEYAQAYRAGIFRSLDLASKFIFTDLIPDAANAVIEAAKLMIPLIAAIANLLPNFFIYILSLIYLCLYNILSILLNTILEFQSITII